MTEASVSNIDKFALFEKIGFVPHAGQQPVLLDQTRNRVVSAGRRFGKSEIGGEELVPEALLTYGQRQQLEDQSKRREFWIVGPEYSDSEKEFRVVYNRLRRLKVPFDKPGTYNNPWSGDMHISLWNGLFLVTAKSAKYPDSLVGEGLSGVVLAEAAKLKERVWTKFIRATLADFHGWALFTSTPEGKNWFYDLFMRGQDPMEAEWQSWRMPSWINPYVYRQPTTENAVTEAMRYVKARKPVPRRVAELVDPEIMSLIRDLTPETFNQEVAALFTEYVGRVFKDFDDTFHVGDYPYDPSWQTYGAVDYGFTNPSVWLLIQVGPFNEIRVIDEYYQAGLTIDEFGIEVKSRGLCPDSLIKFYPDPASPGDTKALSKYLRKPFGGGTGGELTLRLEMIRRALRVPRELAHLPEGHPERIPKLLIDRRCTNLIREMNDYRYPKSAEEAAAQGRNAPEAPMKKDDHAPEALGRFFAGHFGPGSVDRGGTRIRKSNMRR